MSGLHTGFKVPPQSKIKIWNFAQNVRSLLSIPSGVIDAAQLLERLFPYGIVVDVFDHASAPVPAEVEACWVPLNQTLYIRDTVYDGMCDGDPRCRFTLAHEIGHILLGHQITLNRESNNAPMKVYENSEWQANTFASSFLMPYCEMMNLKPITVQDVMNHFGVSQSAAEVRWKEIRKIST